ncbi:MAG: hypothetical protein IJY48_07825, partial [Mailhella sp.]|nr:hypothetical protein [Mailhella sp.]
MAAQSNHDQAEAQNITALSAGGIAEAAQSANAGGMADDTAAPANSAPNNEGGNNSGGTDNAGNDPADSGGIASPPALGGIAASPAGPPDSGNSGNAPNSAGDSAPTPYELTAPEGFDIPAE